MRVIMVPVADRPESETALKVSTNLAIRLNAALVGLHVRAHRHPEEGFLRSDSKALNVLIAKDSPQAARSAKQLFRNVVEDEGFTVRKQPRLAEALGAQWLEKVGSPEKIMAIVGPLADLTVLSRPKANGHLAKAFLLASLMQSSRPVLVMPPKQTRAPGKRIAIAWNQSMEVSRVVTDSIDMLREADQVNIIVSGPENRLGPKASQLKNYLLQWGIKSKQIKTPGKSTETEVLQVYRDTKSDLLMMGAYSRSRFREMVFGGMTEHMLWRANIPVLLQHG